MNQFTAYISPVSTFVIATLIGVFVLSLVIAKAKIHEDLKTLLYIGIIKSIFLSLIFVDIGLTDLEIKYELGSYLYPLYAILELVFIIKFLQFISASKGHGKT